MSLISIFTIALAMFVFNFLFVGLLNLNHISNGEDITDAYDVTTVTCADGVEYKVFTQISQSKKTDRIFVA